jgi:outer membrane protein
MSFKTLLPTALLIAAVITGRPQEPTSLSLAQAQEYALKNGFSVKNARLDAESAKLQSDELLGLGLPQLSGSIQYQNFLDLPTSIVPGTFFGAPGQDIKLRFGVPQQMTAGISATQLLFDGSWLVGLQASKAYAGLMNEQVKKSEMEIRKDVAQAYHLALIAEKNAELLLEGKEVLAETHKQTKALFSEGFVEEQDVDQLQLSLIEWESRITNAEAQRKLSYNLLLFTIGMPINSEVILSDKAESLISAGSGVLMNPTFSADNSIDVRLAETGLSLQELNLKNKRAALLPQLGAFYNLQSQALRREFNFFDTSKPWFPIQLWGIQLNVPILSGGSKMKSIGRANVEVRRLKETVAYTKEATLLEFNSASTEYQNALSTYKNTGDAYSLAQKILERTHIKFREGVSTSFDVSQTTSQTLQAEGNYIQAHLNLMNAQIRLQKALNQL